MTDEQEVSMDGELEGSLVPKTTWLGCSIQPVSSETEEAEPEAEAEIEAADEPGAEAETAAEAEHKEEVNDLVEELRFPEEFKTIYPRDGGGYL